MNRVKRAAKVLREKGVKVFFSKTIDFAVNLITRTGLRSLYIKLFIIGKREKIIKEIADFHSNDRNEIFNFIQKKHFGVFGAEQIKSEFMELLKMVENDRPKYALEVGTADGGTLFCLSRLSSEDAILMSVDLPGGKFGGRYEEWRLPVFKAFKKGDQKLFLIREDSHKNSTLISVKEALNGHELDFLFIDGDHSYEGVKKDFEMYGPLVKNGGIVAFHDIVDGFEEYVGGVPRFWEEIKSGREYKEFVEDRNQGGWGIGVFRLKR